MSFGKKYVVFCGNISPRRATVDDVLDSRRRAAGRQRRPRPRRRARPPRSASRRVGESLVAAARRRARRRARLDSRRRARSTRPRGSADLTTRPRSTVLSALASSVPRLGERAGASGKISRPGLVVETSTTSICALAGRPILLAEGDGRLVAVVPVRDQELLVVEVARRASGRRSARASRPRPRDRARDRALDRRGAVVEQEDRLQLRVRAQQAQAPSFGPACVRSCGSTVPVAYGSTSSDATSPTRVRATPSGPT